MKLTITQALNQAVAAHKAGNLQVAERLYRAILVAEPTHPDAHHNIGVLTGSAGKSKLALEHFESAVQYKPQVEQYWLSYIGELLRSKQFRKAKQVIEDAKRCEISVEKLQVFEERIRALPLSDPSDLVHKSVNHNSARRRHGSVKQSSSKRQQKNHAIQAQQAMNRVIDLFQNRKYAEAEKLSKSLIQKYPNHVFGWKALGAIFKSSGRIAEALEANEKAVSLSPKDAEVHVNLGITLKSLDRLAEAKACYIRAIALKPNYAVAHNCLGSALRGLNRQKDAELSYKRAISLNPNFAEAHNNLGITFHELGRFKEAEVHYKQALSIEPSYANAYFNLGTALFDQGKLEGAVAQYKRAIAIKPEYTAAHYSLGKAYKELAKLREATESFERALSLDSDHTGASNELLTCLFLAEDRTRFSSLLDSLLLQRKLSATIGSLTSRSALRYGIDKPNLFCQQPMKYALHSNLKISHDFEGEFINAAKRILSDKSTPFRRQTLLVKGVQTFGNLFDINDPSIIRIEGLIRTEIEKYRNIFHLSEEGLIKNWPENYNLFGWLISIKSGGALRPHIHEHSWLSGSVYINVPEDIDHECGSLVISLGEEKDVAAGRKNIKKVINVATGSMVLFPASLMHHTTPFESKEERIVLAFDVKPVN